VTLFESWTSAGSLFHTVGVAILKARAPHTVRDLGKCNTSLDDERSVTDEFITRRDKRLFR